MIAFSLGSIHVYWYGIFYFIAIVFAYFFLSYIKKFDYLSHIAPAFYRLIIKSREDILLYAVAGVLIWGRLGDVLIYNFSYYLHNPLHILAIWEGGMSFIGGIVWVVWALLLLAWKYRFRIVDFFVMMDVLMIPVTFGIMIGRIGNFLNQELYGIVVPSGFWWMWYGWFSLLRDLHIFYVYPTIDQVLRVNTNFLSSFFEGFVLLIVFLIVSLRSYKKKTWSVGLNSSLFLMLYSWVRFVLEYLRVDSQMEYVWWFTRSQWFFVIFFVLGGLLFFRRKKLFTQ